MRSLPKKKIHPFPLNEIATLQAVRKFAINNPTNYTLDTFFRTYTKASKDFYATPHILKKRFPALYGITLIKFLHDCRMVKAAGMLIDDTTLPIKCIANEVGYKVGFHTTFKKHYGLNPTEYRRRKKKIYTPKQKMLIAGIIKHNKAVRKKEKVKIFPLFISVENPPPGLQKLLNYLNNYKEK